MTPKTGEVVGVKYVTPEEGLMLITQEGMIIRLNVSGVREVGRSAQGVRLMNLDPEDRIVAVAKLAEKDEETEIKPPRGTAVQCRPSWSSKPADEPDDSDDGLAILDEAGFDEEDDDEGGDPDETVH